MSFARAVLKLRFIFVLLALFSLVSCQRPGATGTGELTMAPAPAVDPSAPEERPEIRALAVMPFVSPEADWQYLGGYLPEVYQPVSPAALAQMDQALDGVAAGVNAALIGVARTRECMDRSAKVLEPVRSSYLKYWKTVGDCLGVRWLLVPQSVLFVERDGGPMGATRAAHVNFDLNLFDAKEGRVVRRFHFDYEQKALTDNLLEVNKFIARKGRWLSAQELAAEGMKKGLKDLGL